MALGLGSNEDKSVTRRPSDPLQPEGCVTYTLEGKGGRHRAYLYFAFLHWEANWIDQGGRKHELDITGYMSVIDIVRRSIPGGQHCARFGFSISALIHNTIMSQRPPSRS